MEKKYGIVGCGMMGCEHIRNIGLLEGARVSVVFDPVADLALKAAGLAGDAYVAESIEDLIRFSELDAIVIASPNFCHVDQLHMIAAHRALPILCEKPAYINAEDEKRLVRFQSDYRAPVWVAMEYRFMPPIAQMLAEVDAVTGSVRMLTIKEHRQPFLQKVGDWNRFNANTGGTLVEKCCHFFDLMRLILKAEPVRVMASAGQVTNHLDEAYEGKVPDIWDSGYVLFDFENGARAMLELCMFADGALWNEELCAIGEGGKIEARIPGPQRFWPTAELGPSPEPELSIFPRAPKAPATRQISLDPTLVSAGDHHGSTFFQHERFLGVVQGRASVEVTLKDGIRAVQMGLAAQKSAQEQRLISLAMPV